MTQQVINVGTTANDGQGDPLREAFIKCNDNFTELYNTGGYAGIANGTSNIFINESANITMSVGDIANVVVISPVDMAVQGNVSADYFNAVADITSGGFFVGNGRLLTGVQVSGSGLTGNALANNIIFSNLTTVGTLVELVVAGNTVSPVIVTNTIKSNDSSIVTVDDGLEVDGSLSVTGTIYAADIVGNVVIDNIESVAGNITAGNILTSGQASATGNITGGNILTGGVVSVVGNVYGSNFIGNLTGNITTNTISVAGNITGGNLATAGALSATSANLSGNLVGGNILTGGIVSATSNVYGTNFIGNVSGNLTGNLIGNIITNAISIAGNVTSGNIVTGGLVSAVANITGGNILSQGVVSAAGNIYSNNFIGNLTGNIITNAISIAGNITSGNLLTNGMVSAIGDITGSNVTATSNVGAVNFSASSTVTGGSLISLGIISAVGNVIAGNLTTPGQVSASGNITGGNLAVTGNISVNYINASTDITGVDLSATSRVIAANITSYGKVSAVGDITSGNLITTGVVSAGSVSASGNVTGGNIFTSGTVIASGNLIGKSLLLQATGKVLGEFSGPASSTRTLFQTNSANAPSFISVVPGAGYTPLIGSPTIGAGFSAYNDAVDLGNSAGVSLAISGDDARIWSVRTGTTTPFLPITIYTSNVEQVRIDTAGNVGMGNTAPQDRLAVNGNAYISGNITSVGNVIVGIVKTVPLTYDTLPGAANIGAGARAFITDGNTTAFYSTVGNGGSNGVPVFSDGTNWRVG